jgi:hypothetical protein
MDRLRRELRRVMHVFAEIGAYFDLGLTRERPWVKRLRERRR